MSLVMQLDFRPISKDQIPAFERFRDAFIPGEHDMYPPGSMFAIARTDPQAYVELIESFGPGKERPPGIVATETFWVYAGDEIAGEVHVRHHVQGRLWHEGGHVGYSVQPKFRRRGVATSMLRFACDRLRDLGEYDALLTCWEENAASAAVIEKCGGVRIPNSICGGRDARRYLIRLV